MHLIANDGNTIETENLGELSWNILIITIPIQTEYMVVRRVWPRILCWYARLPG